MDESKFTHASVELPQVDSIIDADPKPAESDEDDEDRSVEVKTGTAIAGEEKGWYEVQFEEPFDSVIDRPIVNATGVQRVATPDSVEFTPPSLEVEGLDLAEIDDVSASTIDSLLVETQDVQSSPVSTTTIGVGDVRVGDVTVGDMSIGEVTLGSIEIDTPEVPESDISHDMDIGADDLSISSPTMNTDVRVSDFDVDIGTNIDVVDGIDEIEFPIIDIADVVGDISELDISDLSFEQALKETNRETGELLYDELDARLDFPYSDTFMDAWDAVMQFVYGYGDSRNWDRDGVIEAAWGIVGARLDDLILNDIQDSFDNVEFLMDEIDYAFDRLMHGDFDDDGLIDTFENFNRVIEEDVQDRFNEVVDELERTQIETDDGFSEISSAVESAFSDYDQFLEDELIEFTSDLESDIIDFIDAELVTTFEDIDDALFDIEDEMNRMSLDVDEELSVLAENVNFGFEDLAISIERSFEDQSEEIEIEVNDVLEDMEVDINDNFRLFEDEVNDVLLGVEDDVNLALEDFEFEVNDSIEELEIEVNESLEDIEFQINDSLTELEEEINDAIEDMEVDVNSSISDIEDGINSTIEQINDNNESLESRVNTALAEITQQAETALNESLSLLYETMGMPEGELMVPVQIRNVSNESFEFLGYEGGTEINWTAMGRSGSEIGGDPIHGDDEDDDDNGDGDRDRIIDDIIDVLEEENMLEDAVREVAREGNLNI